MANEVTVQQIEPQSFETDMKAQWLWNGTVINGTSKTLYHAPSNLHGGRLTFEEIPELGNAPMMSSGHSWACWKVCLFSKAEAPAVNLYSVMGLPIDVEINSTSIDDRGEVLGQVHQTARLEEVSPGKLRAETQIKADYHGPKNVTWSPGYAVWLRQAEERSIDAVYGQLMIHEHGRFFNIARRRYSYYSDNVLPFDMVWHYKLLTAHTEVRGRDRIWNYSGTAYYSPAKAWTPDRAEFDALFEAFVGDRSMGHQIHGTKPLEQNPMTVG